MFFLRLDPKCSDLIISLPVLLPSHLLSKKKNHVIKLDNFTRSIPGNWPQDTEIDGYFQRLKEMRAALDHFVRTRNRVRKTVRQNPNLAALISGVRRSRYPTGQQQPPLKKIMQQSVVSTIDLWRSGDLMACYEDAVKIIMQINQSIVQSTVPQRSSTRINADRTQQRD